MKKSIKKSIKKLVSLLCMTCVLAGGVTVAHATDGTAVTNEPIIIKSTTDEGAINDNFVQIKGVYKVKNCEWKNIKPTDEKYLAGVVGIFGEDHIIPTSSTAKNANWRAIFDLSTYSGKYEVYFLNLNQGTGADKTGTGADMEAHIEIVDKNGKTILASYKPIEKGNGEWLNCGIHELDAGSSLTIYRDTDGAANLRITAVKLVPTETQINDVNIEAQINNINYESFQDAIKAANNGDIIKLLRDVTLTGDDGGISFSKGTLDLNGKILTASSFTAFTGTNVVDNSDDKTGVLEVTTFVPAETNTQMPIYNGSGYVFIDFNDIKKQEDGGTVSDEGVFDLIFRPSFGEAVNTSLARLGNDAQVKFIIRLKWDGIQEPRDLYYSDDLVEKVYREKMAFSITASGVENFTGLTITPLVQSTLNSEIEWCGTPYSVN